MPARIFVELNTITFTRPSSQYQLCHPRKGCEIEMSDLKDRNYFIDIHDDTEDEIITTDKVSDMIQDDSAENNAEIMMMGISSFTDAGNGNENNMTATSLVVSTSNEKVREIKQPWHNGYWYCQNQPGFITFVNGEVMELKRQNQVPAWPSMIQNSSKFNPKFFETILTGNWTHGNFGPANEKISQSTGIQNYNLKIECNYIIHLGVVDKSGKQILACGIDENNEDEVIERLNWVDFEEAQKIQQNQELHLARIGEWETGKATVSYQVINSTLPQTITPFEYTSTFFEILTNAISTSENEKMKMFPAAMVQKKSKNLESTSFDSNDEKDEITMEEFIRALNGAFWSNQNNICQICKSLNTFEMSENWK